MARWAGVFQIVIGRIDRIHDDGRSTPRSRAIAPRHVTVTTFELACGHTVTMKPGGGGGYVRLGVNKRRCPTCTARAR